jgi:hypothetical protein
VQVEGKHGSPTRISWKQKDKKLKGISFKIAFDKGIRGQAPDAKKIFDVLVLTQNIF